jgi:hypothetical protein
MNSTSRPIYPRERDPVPTVQEAGWAPEPVWKGVEKRKSLASTGDRTRERPARSESLYRLHYPGPYLLTSEFENAIQIDQLPADECGLSTI